MADEPLDNTEAPPLRAHALPRRPPLASRLRAITQDWRATADAWQRESEATRDLHLRPPQPSAPAIANWINWLKACAKQIDDELDE